MEARSIVLLAASYSVEDVLPDLECTNVIGCVGSVVWGQHVTVTSIGLGLGLSLRGGG